MNKLLSLAKNIWSRRQKIEQHIALLGMGVTMKVLYDAAIGYYESSLRRKVDVAKIYGSESYAVITGGANGIGKEFAYDLASKGFNLILIDCDQNALENVKTEIIFKYKVDVRIFLVDFGSMLTVEDYQNLTDQFQGFDISILINNVGVGAGSTGYFHMMPPELMLKAFRINVYPAVFITRALIDQMSKRKSRSLIINMSSASALYPLSYFFLYGAAKSFLWAFGEALHLEQLQQKSNIDVISMTPMYISTKLIRFKKGTFIISTEDFVQSTWRQVSRTDHSIGHWKHRLQVSFRTYLWGNRFNSFLERSKNKGMAENTLLMINKYNQTLQKQ